MTPDCSTEVVLQTSSCDVESKSRASRVNKLLSMTRFEHLVNVFSPHTLHYDIAPGT